jgi:hypothetical protein
MMRRSVSGYVGWRHVFGVALRFGTAGAAIGAAEAAAASVAGRILRTGARVARGVVSRPAILNDPIRDLGIR